MTAMLGCDGCGSIVSERPDDDDPTRHWLCLTEGPSIAGDLLGLALPMLVDEELVEAHDLENPAPARHFCSTACLASWAVHQVSP